MVLADSYKVSRAPYYLGYSRSSEVFVYRTVTVYGGPFQSSSTNFFPFLAESRDPDMTFVISV